MKIFLIISSIVIGAFIIFQIYITMSSNKTETQQYKIIREEEKFEIRYYPSATMAMVSSKLKSYRDLGYSGFGVLAKYIFGGNSVNQQIAMTSPVHMNIGDSISTMAFVMPANLKKEDLPKPNNNDVVIKTSEPEYVAAVKFGGFATTTSINKQKAILEKALKDKGITFTGNFRYLGYNPPYQFFGRRNEVIVVVNSNNFN